ncbi:hypothetical protein C1878_11975 [Gordonibacter sp. 28C]|uniref:MFS transporter n=1 Tax=Gordonibacter sp. 28C TaxID=2078569 RepID=UPI000DF7642E|nr:MFS transporter [Gordonibacter sp. 28C]RDB61205.1 hypothetical protein C1878_11975 [Gordonibacter sp. 28C]
MAELTADQIAKQDKVSGKAWGILAVTYLASFCAPLCQFKIPPLASWLFPAFHGALDSVTFGTLMSAIAIIGVVLAFPAAFIARRMGLKNVILLSVACLGVGSALGGLANDLAGLMGSRLLEGVGIGLIGVAAPSCVTIWFPERKRGLALGIWATWVPVGSVVAFNTAPAIAGAFGYQAVFFAIAVVCAVAFALFALVYKMPPGATGDMGVEGTFKESLRYCKNRRIWILGAVFFLFAFTTIGIMNTYYNTFLETQLGFDAQTASTLSSVIMFLSLIVAPLTGFVSDRLPLGRKYIVGLVMMLLLIPTGFFMFYTGNGAVAVMWVTIVLQGVGGGMCGGSLRPMAPMLMRNTAMGATMAMAIMQFCQNLGSAVGSPLFGAVMSQTGWQTASLVLQLPAYVLAFVLCFFILPRGKNVKKLDDVPAEEAWPSGF